MTDEIRFSRSSYSDIEQFFSENYLVYDHFSLKNPFWSFSNAILSLFVRDWFSALHSSGESWEVLDAGCGTGMWSTHILQNYRNSLISGVDYNANMISVARGKFPQFQHGRWRITQSLLEEYKNPNKFDAAICFHNVIGLSRDTRKTLLTINDALKPNGRALIMAPNKHHSALFHNKMNNLDESERVAVDGTVKFKDDMPEIFCYTPEEFHLECSLAGFKNVTVYGFPVSYRAGIDDALMSTDSEFSSGTEASILHEYQKCLSVENAFLGNNLIATCLA